jgi:hypothetical protein
MTAFVAALGELKNVAHDRRADTGTFAYGYTSRGAMLDHARTVLAKHDLAVVQDLTTIDGLVSVETLILHPTGAVIRFGPFRLPAGPSAQSAGSAATYAEKYALGAALGIVGTEDDDDGHAAAPPAQETAKPSPRKRKMHALYNKAGMTDRHDRLAHASAILGREVASSSDLTAGELDRVIADLEQLVATLQKLDQ